AGHHGRPCPIAAGATGHDAELDAASADATGTYGRSTRRLGQFRPLGHRPRRRAPARNHDPRRPGAGVGLPRFLPVPRSLRTSAGRTVLSPGHTRRTAAQSRSATQTLAERARATAATRIA